MDERTQVKQKFQPGIQALEAQEARGQFPRALLAFDDLHEMCFFIRYLRNPETHQKVSDVPDYVISHSAVFPASALSLHKLDSILYGAKQGFGLDLQVIGLVPFSEKKRDEALDLGKVINSETLPHRTNLRYCGEFGERILAVYISLPNCKGYKQENVPLNLTMFT